MCDESVEVRVREGWLDSDGMGRMRKLVCMHRFFNLIVFKLINFVVRGHSVTRVKDCDIIKVSPKSGHSLLSSQPHCHLGNILPLHQQKCISLDINLLVFFYLFNALHYIWIV